MAHPLTTRRARGWLCAIALAAAFARWAMPAAAQETPPPETREEQIELERLQKRVRLWPEREGGLVARANSLLDRGLLDGIKSGRGPNGWQVRFTGTRSAQGQSFGIGYRRSDLFRDAVSARGAMAATIHGAVHFDVEVRINRFRRSEGTYLDIRGAYDRAPRMNFYGLGADSREEDRTVYLLQTHGGQVRAGYRFTKQLNAGFEVLGGRAHTGPGTNGDIPSIETRFDATTAPGLFDDTTFYWWGGFVGFDTRDLPSGPKRGGFYGVNLHRYEDVSSGKYSHRRLEIEGQQFFPYFNDTRVLAILVRSEFAYTGSDDRVVPFYLQPTLGGSIELRGYNAYRFYDNNAFNATIEHRWYAFTGLEMALFLDAGKTVSEKGNIDLTNLNYSGGIGFRARIQNAIVLRFDIARSHEGFRWIWSVSDVSRRLF